MKDVIRPVSAESLDVSRETFDRLSSYVDLLLQWQQRLNLISPKTVPDIWQRHIRDSLQLRAYLTDKADGKPLVILDVGAGAGLPGIVLSIATGHRVHLVESDQRKSSFLRRAISETGAPAIIHNQRIEHLPHLQADILMARAFAPLPKLLEITQKQHHPDLKFILPKGRDVDSELTQSSNWATLVWQKNPSEIAEDSTILTGYFQQDKPGGSK